MTSLIKSSVLSGAQGTVRAFGAARQMMAPDEPSREDRLETRIAELEAQLAAAEKALPRKLDKAREEGARKALEMRSDAETKALAKVEETLGSARDQWVRHLESWGSASAGISRAVLEQVFADPQTRSHLVQSAIAKRLELLEAGSVVRIRVSGEDFADEAALTELRQRIGCGFDVNSDPSLHSGGCVLDLKLGHLDLDLKAQWQRIAELLDMFEREGLEP